MPNRSLLCVPIFIGAGLLVACFGHGSDVKKEFESLEALPQATARQTFSTSGKGDLDVYLRAVLYSTEASEEGVWRHYKSEFMANAWGEPFTAVRSHGAWSSDRLEPSIFELPGWGGPETLALVTDHWDISNDVILTLLVSDPDLGPSSPERNDFAAVIWLEGCAIPARVLFAFSLTGEQNCFIVVVSNTLIWGDF
jgi:hypothetical protein